MTVIRKTTINTDELQIGDQIAVGKYTATCQKVEDNTALFCFDQYLDDAKPISSDNTNAGGYAASDLRNYLTTSESVKELFKDYTNVMIPMEHGDLVRIPTFGEIFGWTDNNSWVEPDTYIQWPLMKFIASRVAYREDDYEWGWLQNRSVRSASHFAVVSHAGYANDAGARYAYGVRPVFTIKYPES